MKNYLTHDNELNHHQNRNPKQSVFVHSQKVRVRLIILV